jgi:PAS domain S-box-containing protein
LEKLQTIQVLMESAEASVSRYVITGDPASLSPYQEAQRVIPQRLRQIKSRSPKPLNRLVLVHLQYLSNIVAARKAGGYAAAEQWVLSEDNVSVRQALARGLSDLQEKESAQVRRRSTTTSRHSSKVTAGLVLFACVSLGFLAGAFGLLRRESDGRVLAESETERMETFLHSIIERIPYRILVKEATNLRLTLVNKAASEWLGRSETELLGSNAYDLRPHEEAQHEVQQDRQVLRDGKAVNIPEESLVLPSGEARTLHTQKVSIPDQNGAPAYLVTISEDITERKQAQRMLELSRDAAEESARVKAEFLRNMSHEFRTPLSIIIGMTSLLLDSELSDEQRRFASTVQRAAGGLTHLTKDILDFSKMESGTFTLETQEISIRPAVDSVVAMFSEQARAKGVGLVSLIPNEIPATLLGDGIRLRQVLTQLVGNAVKFTSRGEVILRITKAKEDETRLWLTCRITDTGIGIDPDVQKHLFEVFRQGDGSRTRQFGGTGLGLAMSRRIVELMGGEIGFESAPKEGSSFWFTLPFQKRGSSFSPIDQPSLPWTRARVLVVDENETVRQLLRQQLGTWALASEGVSSGEAALTLLRREQKAGRPFAIVLLDMHLPDMESVDFARAVKQDPHVAQTQLLVMTTSDSPLDPATGSSLGFSGWIFKPPQPEALFEHLSLLIEPVRQDHPRAA